MNDTDLNIRIHANTREALANIQRLEQEIRGFSRGVNSSSSNVESFTSTLRTMAGVYVGFEVLKGSISKVLDVGMSFEKSIDKLGAVSKASTTELEAMKQKAEELGSTTQFTATQVADAMNFQAMAGMKSNEILAATKDILDLAVVGNMDLARASDIATDSMSGFGLGADDLNRVVDVMATTITNSNTDVEQLGEAFKNVAPVAKNLNISLEETSSMLGILANAGRKGGEAGTHLKIILQRLASTTKPVVKGLKSLGLSAYDSNGKLKPLTGTLKDIKSKLKDLDDKSRNKILKDLFGEEAISSANIILDNLDSMDTLLKKVSDSAGSASKMAKEMNNNLDGDVKNLNSALEGLANTIYEHLLPALREMTQNLTESIRYVNENSEEFIKWGKTIVEVVAQVYLLRKAFLGLAIISMVPGITTLGGAFFILASKIRIATASLINFTKLNAPLLIVAIAIGGVTYKLNELEAEVNKLNKITDRFNTTSSSTESIYKKLNSTYDESINKYKMTREEYDKLGEAIGIQLSKLEDEIEKRKKASDGTLEQKDRIFQLERQQKTLIESYKVVSDKLEIVDSKTKKATKSTKELAEETKKANEKYIKDSLSTYKTRESQHENTIQRLLAKEKKLNQDILDEKKRFNSKLKDLENQRLIAVESLESKIHNLGLAGESDYEKYIDSKKEADKLYYKAKESLQKGNLTLAKKYMSDYQSLTSQIANTEIKEGERVLVSKKESAKVGMDNLKKLKVLTNDYYTIEKQKALDIHNQKLAQIKVQLQATKAQLEMEVQRLNLEKQMIELLTGKKVEIDTTSAINSIKSLDGQIKGLDSQIEDSKKVKIDNSQAISSIQKVKQTYGSLTLGTRTIEIKADTTPADFGIDKLLTTTKGRRVFIKVNPEYEKAQDKIENAIKKFESRPIKTEVTAETQKAIQEVDKLKKLVEKPSIHKIDADAKKAFQIITRLKQNTSSTHTVYVKEVHQRASGGIIPLKLATGGEANFERKSGRIAGYDPTDSDDVPALLTRGEFVIKRDAVAHYGDDFLYNLNSMNLPKYATGGLVDIGTPAKLIEDISNNNDSDFANDSSLDKLDFSELIEKLQELKDTLLLGNEKTLPPKLTSMQTNLESQTKEYEKLQQKSLKDKEVLQSLKNNDKSKVFSKQEYDNSQAKQQKIQNKINLDEKNLKGSQNKGDKKESDAKKLIHSVEFYLKQVEQIKSKVEKKLQAIGLNSGAIDGLEYSLDLGKLQKFYKTLSKLKDSKALENDYSTMMRTYNNQYERARFKTFGRKFLKKPKADYFLFKEGIDSNTELESKIQSEINQHHTTLNDDVIRNIQLSRIMANIPKFQTGGKLNGYGGGDRNLALLEDGEFIVRKEAVSHYGDDLMGRLNNIQLPKFQTGGMVGSVPKTSITDQTNINFTLPNGNAYEMRSDVDVASEFAQDLRRLM